MQVLQQADILALPAFQFFVAKAIKKQTSYISPTLEEKIFLRELVAKHQTTPIIHASYWINAASGRDNAYTASKSLLKKELSMAKALDVPFLVLHPGTANGFAPDLMPGIVKRLGIERLANLLNEVLKNQSDITILLENTAHGGNAIGSDLQDFRLIKELLEQPEKVHFCLDTAHAHAYGYDLGNFEIFLETIESLIGINNIKLIHLNDIEGDRGSKQDKHTLPGEGQLGLALLQKIAHFKAFSHIPKIIELPDSRLEIIQNVVTNFSKTSQ
jgi:deoxyribonuclease-4